MQNARKMQRDEVETMDLLQQWKTTNRHEHGECLDSETGDMQLMLEAVRLYRNT